jgi:predicted Rossmann-fold nucleotide-binding protein
MLVQTKKMHKIPIVLMGRDFWRPLIVWFDQTMNKGIKTIKPEDLKLFQIVDKAEDAMKIIKKSRERTIF